MKHPSLHRNSRLAVIFSSAALTILWGKCCHGALNSPAFEQNGHIPSKYTCEGKDISPPLASMIAFLLAGQNLPESFPALTSGIQVAEKLQIISSTAWKCPEIKENRLQHDAT
jgi:hypothetical protein